MIEVYIALGGNLAGTLQAMRQTALRIKEISGIETFASSRLYQTTPVSPIPQDDYLNAVCRFKTNLELDDLWQTLQTLEQELGKETKKTKNCPRLIDIDLLFYGDRVVNSNDLTVPHPRWNQRLFVLTPLADVAGFLPIGLSVQEILENFCNPHQERVSLVKERL